MEDVYMLFYGCFILSILLYHVHFISGLVATATTGAALKKMDKTIDKYQIKKKKKLMNALVDEQIGR
jgi:hypothetical protein